jgi:hypothetical protein
MSFVLPLEVSVQTDPNVSYSSVILKDPTNTYGIRRRSDGGVVVEVGEEMVDEDYGLYAYSFSDSYEEGPWDYAVETTVYKDNIVHYFFGSVEGFSATVTTRYCSLVKMEYLYGYDNLRKWTRFGEDNESVVNARLGNFMEQTDQFIDDTLRNGVVVVPFADVEDNPSTPNTIQTLANTWAGVLAYEARGTDDFDPETGGVQHKMQFHRKRVLWTLARIKQGLLTIEDLSTISVPTVGAAATSDQLVEEEIWNAVTD